MGSVPRGSKIGQTFQGRQQTRDLRAQLDFILFQEIDSKSSILVVPNPNPAYVSEVKIMESRLTIRRNASRQNVDVKIWVAAEQSATNESFRDRGWTRQRVQGVFAVGRQGARDGNGDSGGQVFVFVSCAAKRCRSIEKTATLAVLASRPFIFNDRSHIMLSPFSGGPQVLAEGACRPSGSQRY